MLIDDMVPLRGSSSVVLAVLVVSTLAFALIQSMVDGLMPHLRRARTRLITRGSRQ